MSTDRETFERLLDEHGATAMALLRRLGGSPHDAEDVFQDVALRVWRNLGSRPRLRNARAWLLTIAYRAHLDHQARRPSYLALRDDDEPAGTGRRGDDPVALAEHQERCRLLDAAVLELTPALRSVIVLHYTGGLSLREIAAATGLSTGTVKSRLNAGLEKLRRRMT